MTHGQQPRQHIWTFAAVHDETSSGVGVCPCTKTDTPYTGAVPLFIGQDYTSVTLVAHTAGNTSSITKILSGMAQAVDPLAAAVASTTHHGSVNNYHNQPQTT